jgi:hypothetical protein
MIPRCPKSLRDTRPPRAQCERNPGVGADGTTSGARLRRRRRGCARARRRRSAGSRSRSIRRWASISTTRGFTARAWDASRRRARWGLRSSICMGMEQTVPPFSRISMDWPTGSAKAKAGFSVGSVGWNCQVPGAVRTSTGTSITLGGISTIGAIHSLFRVRSAGVVATMGALPMALESAPRQAFAFSEEPRYSRELDPFRLPQPRLRPPTKSGIGKLHLRLNPGLLRTTASGIIRRRASMRDLRLSMTNSDGRLAELIGLTMIVPRIILTLTTTRESTDQDENQVRNLVPTPGTKGGVDEDEGP